ncbi:MAG: DUF1631 domain-containing protein [Proteobacteria bacterium]|nr:DUF1631 domain-containing protein [Pseudomonadota bacterium]
MTDLSTPRFHPLLDAAIQRVKQAVLAAAERTVESLGLSAMGAFGSQRDALLAAQFELNRKLVGFAQAFDHAFDQQLNQEAGGGRGGAAVVGPAGWEALTLVEDRELEIKVQAERFGLEISHACEWELRELEAYVGSLLDHGRADRERNPLRPELIGHGVIRAVDATADRPDVRRVLDGELQRSLAAVLRSTYAEIVSELRKAGVQPVSLTVRTTESAGGGGGGGEHAHSRATPLDAKRGEADDGGGGGGGRSSAAGGLGPHSAAGRFEHGADARHSSNTGHGSLRPRGSGGARGTPIGQVDASMMELLRRLAHADAGSFDASGSGSAWGGDGGGGSGGGAAAALPNLIHANRDELKQASRGALDHMVIDVIGSLFDQILSDPKVPPQLARHIARLQLPVLRAALGDPSFFSSRKHPVRQFINRIASLGQGFDDFSGPQAQTFLAKVRDLVQEIVQGDFDQIETYATRLTALEAFVADQARRAVEAHSGGATALLQQREEALRLSQHYEQRLDDELQPLAAPAFVRDFVSRVWSRVILKAAERDGVTSERVRALRQTGRDLFMSVQPKTSPAQRKAFLAELPTMMQHIAEGLNAIGWPEARRREFFGQLMPAHAEALKAATGRVLDFNMLARQVDQALERHLPTRKDLPPAPMAAPLDDAEAEAGFTAEEAARIGLVQESAVDWNAPLDIDLSAGPELSAVDLELPGLPAPADLAEPVSGRSLADHVQIGFSYQMQLEGSWQKVRLAHVSPGRSFFAFTHGARHQRTISLTHRMLVKLCEAGRMRAFENAQLLERATARARQQLASLAGSAPR